jgi:hypothetical protein
MERPRPATAPPRGSEGVQVAPGPLPRLADDAAPEPLGGVAPEDPVPVEEAAASHVERHVRPADRAAREVAEAVVDAWERDVLDPGRRSLHEPEVLEPVVGELHGVEELVRGGRTQPGDRRVEAEPRVEVVVVEDAVRRHAARAPRGVVVGRAVAEVPVSSEVAEVHVEAPVDLRRGGGEVAARSPVAEPVEAGEGRLERAERPLGPVGRAVSVRVRGRRCRGPGLDPVEADLRAERLHRRALGPAVQLRVARPVRWAGEDPLRLPPLVAAQERDGGAQIAQDPGHVGRAGALGAGMAAPDVAEVDE